MLLTYKREAAVKNQDKASKAKFAAVAADMKRSLAEAAGSYANADEALVANSEKLNSALDRLAISAKSGNKTYYCIENITNYFLL